MFSYLVYHIYLGELPQGTKIERNKDGTVTVNGNTLPPELTVVTNPDGSLSIVPNPCMGAQLPPNATITQDGSLLLPPDTDIVQNEDGSISLNGTKLPPGTEIQKLPDGSVVVKKPTEKVKANSDGSLSIGGIQLPSGTKTTSDGNIVLPQAAKVVQNVDGTVTVDGKTLPKGTNVQQLQDGCFLIIEGSSIVNGNLLLPVSANIVVNPDGTVTIDGKKLPNGTQIQQMPDGGFMIVNSGTMTVPKGSKIVENANGTITVNGKVFPAGTNIQQNPDGSLAIISSANGQDIINNSSNSSLSTISVAGTPLPQGSIVNNSGSVSLPKDTVITRNPDGSLVIDGRVMPPGTSVEVNNDGSITLVTETHQIVPGQSQSAPPPPPIQTSKSGHVTIGNVELPQGAQCANDGSVLLPKGTKITQNPDGTLVVNGKALPRGIVAKTNPDGTISLTASTASTASTPGTINVQTQSDGTLLVGSAKLPKGSAQNMDGSISLPSNCKISRNPDGTVSVDGKKLPPGTTLVTNDDGSVMIVSNTMQAIGVKVNTDGSLSLGQVKLPKGSVNNVDGSISLPKGTQVIQNKDGTILLNGKELPAGMQVINNKDGSLSLVPVTSSLSSPVSTGADGSVIIGSIRLPSGTIVNNDGSISVPQNSKIITNSNGTVTFEGKTFPPGTRLVVNKDGTKVLLLPNTGSLGLKQGFVLCMQKYKCLLPKSIFEIS